MEENMKNNLKITSLLLIAGLLFSLSPLFGQEKPENPAPAPMMAPPIPQLTEEQRVKIQELRLKHMKEILPLETDLQIKRLELENLWTADKLDAKAIIAKVKEINELQNKLELTRVNHRLEIAQILTPEQRRQMQDMLGPGMGRPGRMMRRHRFMQPEQFGPEEPNCCPNR